MKTKRNAVKAALIALLMLSSTAMMGGCGSIDQVSGLSKVDPGSLLESEDTVTSGDYDYENENESGDASGDITFNYEDNSYNSNYNYEDNSSSSSSNSDYKYEDNSSNDSYNYDDNSYVDNSYNDLDDTDSDEDCSDDDDSYVDDEEFCDDDDDIYEDDEDSFEYDDEDSDGDDEYFEYDDEDSDADSDDGEPTGGEISDKDYANDAIVSTNDFEITPLPTRVGGTDAVIKANVINRSGRKVTAVGCTLYYGYGEAIKSTLISCNDDYESFDLEFDINEYLDEKLDRGGLYAYRIFVEADGKIYTHDKGRFETNDVDDKIEIEASVASVSTSSASINIKVFNPTGAKVEAIGCRFGDGIIERYEDHVSGSFTDSELEETITFNADGEFPSDTEYCYEVYVRCDGKEYTIGTDTFKTPLI